jgi:hypothetical protein
LPLISLSRKGQVLFCRTCIRLRLLFNWYALHGVNKLRSWFTVLSCNDVKVINVFCCLIWNYIKYLHMKHSGWNRLDVLNVKYWQIIADFHKYIEVLISFIMVSAHFNYLLGRLFAHLNAFQLSAENSCYSYQGCTQLFLAGSQP